MDHIPYSGTCGGSEKTINPDYAHCKASSVFGGNAIGQTYGAGRLDSSQAWTAGSDTKDQWWQMDISTTQIIAGVVTQGRGDGHNEYVKSFKVKVPLTTSAKRFEANNCCDGVQQPPLSVLARTRASVLDDFEDVTKREVRDVLRVASLLWGEIRGLPDSVAGDVQLLRHVRSCCGDVGRAIEKLRKCLAWR